MLLANIVYDYAYLLKVIFSPTYIILHSLEFHLLLSSGHSAVLCFIVLQHISTGSCRLDKSISSKFDYFEQFRSERL